MTGVWFSVSYVTKNGHEQKMHICLSKVCLFGKLLNQKLISSVTFC